MRCGVNRVRGIRWSQPWRLNWPGGRSPSSGTPCGSCAFWFSLVWDRADHRWFPLCSVEESISYLRRLSLLIMSLRGPENVSWLWQSQPMLKEDLVRVVWGLSVYGSIITCQYDIHVIEVWSFCESFITKLLHHSLYNDYHGSHNLVFSHNVHICITQKTDWRVMIWL